MKKFGAILITGVLVFALSACSSKPSNDKIKQALEDGTITFDDAKEKGWIDDEWINENFEQVEAKSKIYLFDPFETTYLDGTKASSKIIEGKMCLVFFDTSKEETMKKLEVFNEANDKMVEEGVPILGIVTDEDIKVAKEKCKDMKFPIIVYNQEMQESLENYDSIIGTDVTSVFTKEGGFYTAWSSDAVVEDLIQSAKELANEE